jgi:hypothetical protein
MRNLDDGSVRTVIHVHLPISDGWSATWTKVELSTFSLMCYCPPSAKKPEQVQLGVDYVRRVHSGQFDWFMRIDDDSYVIMENLIMFLLTRNTTAPEMHSACVLHYIFVVKYFNPSFLLIQRALYTRAPPRTACK